MLIEIHAIQNHGPANLNRDDLGAPKTCYFGGVLRSRISSQCIKRSIRTSDEFKLLCGGIRTRRLPQYLAEQIKDKDVLPLATAVIQQCGLLAGERNGEKKKKDVIVFLSKRAVPKMLKLLCEAPASANRTQLEGLARQFAELISADCDAPDMALSGRMLEPAKPPKKGKTDSITEDDEDEDAKNKGVWKGLDTKIEAALQVAHAISTHEARPEVDYFVAKDDIPGEDAGGAHIGEALFAAACFYKYFAIHWEQLVKNLQGFMGNKEHLLAAHTVGAFIRAAVLTNPTGKQNSFAAHNPPDGMLVEIKNNGIPISYANAFAKPAEQGERDIISQSIAQLGQYVRDLDIGYGAPQKRFWFSPNLRYSLTAIENKEEIALTENNLKSLDALVPAVIRAIGHDWNEVQKVVVNSEVNP
ncbi:type I-E CRISPR-associated protein Cas7/Cse4/CasC [Candidatus Sumerlaeota bacterium]|nr:type I-E CRISPR-associated protein Cas7/Cse4/CasC [Candidatus Sumerlaeota bacterium]